MAQRLDLAPISKAERTPQGGLRVPAYLTRTGVFVYTHSDGTQTRELRHPSEVFKPESLASLRGAPVTVGHPGEVTPENWQSLAVGHVGDNVRADKGFVAADVLVQAASTVSRVDGPDKDLSELSCGYGCDVEPASGVYEGERYDAVQKNIIYNHVALGPKDWGRAGGEVRLRLDSPYTMDMTIRKDSAMAETPKTDAPAAPPVNVVVHTDTAELDRLRGELAAANARASKAETALAEATDPKRLDSLVSGRLALREKASKALGASFKADGLTDRDLRFAVVKAAGIECREDASDDFLAGAFEPAVKLAEAATKATAETRGAADEASRADGDADADDPIAKAQKRSEEYRLNAAKGKSK
jgi:uncharacterized protein